MSDEVYQVPAVFLAICFAGAERRHPGESNAMFDDVEELAIGKLLRRRGAEIERPRIQPTPVLSVTTPVVAVTARAMIGEVFEPGRHCRGRRRYGIATVPVLRGDRQGANHSGSACLSGAWGCVGTEACRPYIGQAQRRRHGDEREYDRDGSEQGAHFTSRARRAGAS